MCSRHPPAAVHPADHHWRIGHCILVGIDKHCAAAYILHDSSESVDTMALLNSDGNLMQYNNLGGTGLMVSEISFGTMTFSDNNNAATGTKKGDFGESAYNMMEAAYKGGINFYDCAEVYGGGGSSERVLGDAIKIGEERGTWERMV
eukprot:SAG31_NODE_298_length_18125_cov_27.373350_14_plen_147_part_00